MSKEITIPVPDGKRAEWINGVLTLVDEPKKVDKPSVIERIKTLLSYRLRGLHENYGPSYSFTSVYGGSRLAFGSSGNHRLQQQ